MAAGLRELALFAGAGGGLLASVLLGHRIVGAVEIDEYCCRVLEQRQHDGCLASFPIFQTDIRDFIRSGYAALYRGRCDLVSAGFPCQPYSLAGKRAGAADDRNLWPETIATIRIVQPSWVFLENVPGLVSDGYIFKVLDDLRQADYQALPPLRLSASDLGADHKRARYWIAAYAHRSEPGRGQQPERQTPERNADPGGYGPQGDALEGRPWWAAESRIC